jgi:hypothetical protein
MSRAVKGASFGLSLDNGRGGDRCSAIGAGDAKKSMRIR